MYPQPRSTTSPLDPHPRGTTSGLDAQLRATSSTTSAYNTGLPAEHPQRKRHNIFMMEAVEEEQPDITSYILQALNIIKEMWTMNVHIGKVTKPSRVTRLLQKLHLQQCGDESRIYLNIRTGIGFRIIIFFLCNHVICLSRPSMPTMIRHNLSRIAQTLYLTDLEETRININDYIAEEAQHLTHHNFFHQDHLLRLLPIALAMTLRDHIPQYHHLAYDPQCHHYQHPLMLLGRLPTKGEEKRNKRTSTRSKLTTATSSNDKNQTNYCVSAIILDNN